MIGFGFVQAWYICDERPVKYLPVLQARPRTQRDAATPV